MERIWQQTIKNSVEYQGIGLHSGKPVQMRFCPGKPNTGFVFVRVDLEGQPTISAGADRVTSTERATTLMENQAHVHTIEHVLAALYLAGIDNCRIELNSPEPPAADGSARIFCELLESAGKTKQTEETRWLVVEEPVQIYDGERFVVILPYPEYRISFTSVNPHPELGTQYFSTVIDGNSCLIDIAPARTIGFINEIEMLQSKGLALGGSLENALVYNGGKSINVPRFPDELVRHKILDVVGDLALCGYRLKGHVIASQSAHALNTQLAFKLKQVAEKEENRRKL